MSIISLSFIIFVVCTFTLYAFVPKRFRWIVLGIASVYFYYCVGINSLCTLILVSVFTYLIARVIDNNSVKDKRRRMWLAVSILLIVSWLFIIKIVAHINSSFFIFDFPLGASYVSFSLISYLVDIYLGKDHAEKTFFKFMLFSLFFLKITQGPISRHYNLKEFLYDGSVISYKNVCFGCQRVIYGYFKKLVIADRIALFTTPLFENIGAYSGKLIVVGTVLAAFQLYCDFSGYMDIMLGIGEMFGIKLEENFVHPLFSKSAAEFWRRWHVTLGTWFRDYIYTPVVMSHTVKKIGKWGRKTVGKKFGNSIMKVIALSTVWLLTGLWHGTGLNYILWGYVLGSNNNYISYI